MSVLSLIPEDKKREFDRKESVESVYSSSSRLNLLQKRKKQNRMMGDMVSESLNGRSTDRYISQRVLSAKTHRVKQLQNQLADAHYHLQELSNENRILRVLQKKHEIALSRYENSSAELPQMLNSHSEEMRIQLARYKQLKHQYRETTVRLKERDLQLQQLRDEHHHLLELSKDRNLSEREKLQAQVTELTSKVQQQSETISMLQRKLTLETKNYKHQLQMEMNKHKDTRHDLDLAISNADKLSTIIEMKEKLMNNAATRKSPTRPVLSASQRPLTKTVRPPTGLDSVNVRMDAPTNMESNIAKLCENSRNLSSVLSHEDDTTSSMDTRFRSFNRSRTNSTSRTISSRKNSKESDDMLELAKTVKDGMSDLAIYDDEIAMDGPDDMQKKIDAMKADLLSKIKNNDEPISRGSSSLRKYSTDGSIEEVEKVKEIERPKSRGVRSSVSFYGDTAVGNVTVDKKDDTERKPKRDLNGIHSNLNSILERKQSSKPVETSCKDIMFEVEKSNKVIDKHLKELNSSKLISDKLVQQLEAVDKMNEFVNAKGDIPDETLEELNNNFNSLTNKVSEVIPANRKRSTPSRRSSATRSNLFGDASMSNQDLLNDLLGKK